MFLLRSRHPKPPGPTLNATSTPEDRAQRRARQLRQCERLAELGMELAEAAHREALREMQPPTPRRSPKWPEIPGLPDPPTYRSSTFGQLFTEMSRCVRQSILLETRLEAGAYDRPRAEVALAAPAPHRDPVPAATSPEQHCADDRPSLEHRRLEHEHLEHERLSHERIEDDLAGEAGRTAPEILTEICEKLGRAADTLATDLPRTLSPALPPQSQPDARPRRDPPPGPTKSRAISTPSPKRVARPPPG